MAIAPGTCENSLVAAQCRGAEAGGFMVWNVGDIHHMGHTTKLIAVVRVSCSNTSPVSPLVGRAAARPRRRRAARRPYAGWARANPADGQMRPSSHHTGTARRYGRSIM